MKAEKLAGLKPEAVFTYFEKLCSIPHGSYNTRKISDYLVSFAREQGLRCIQDEADNVIIFKDASAGYETHAPVILQGHMDMVCQKNEGVVIDMAKEPVDVTHDGQYVFAKGTTLGADDGIGVALCLALLADKTAVHPPLEVIITADEEVGLIGANAIDLSMLKGRRMLNLDTPHDNIFNVGCGGGARVAMELPVSTEQYSGDRVRLTLEGLHGGHSGSQIGKNYANANKAMAELLDILRRSVDFRLVDLSGGVAGNVIPSGSQAVIAVEKADAETITGICRGFIAQLKETNDEPGAVLMPVLLSEKEGAALTAGSTAQVIDFLMALPNGVQQWSPDFKGLPLTSLNLGIVELKESLQILTAVRSGANRNRQQLQDTLKKLAADFGCRHSESGVYSAWEYRKDSPLRDTLVRLYEERNGASPVVRVVHAGLECGVLSEKLPGLDCVSMGPNALEIHTTRERLDIASTERTWNFLLDILKRL